MQRVLGLLLCFYSFIVTASDTVLKLYRPFGEVTEQIVPEMKRKVFGECISQSSLIVREDAWRCHAEGRVFDPCFVPMAGKKMKVLCPQSPWVPDSVQIELRTPLNNAGNKTLDMSIAYPWAIELANGEYCQAIKTNRMFDSMPVHYRCSDQNFLFGYLQRCKPVWSMLEKTSKGVVSVDFKRVWF